MLFSVWNWYRDASCRRKMSSRVIYLYPERWLQTLLQQRYNSASKQEAVFSITSVTKLSIALYNTRNYQQLCGKLHCDKSIDLFSTCCHLFIYRKMTKRQLRNRFSIATTSQSTIIVTYQLLCYLNIELYVFK